MPESVFEIPNTKEASVFMLATVLSMAFFFVIGFVAMWPRLIHPEFTALYVADVFNWIGGTLGFGVFGGFIVMTIHRLWKIRK